MIVEAKTDGEPNWARDKIITQIMTLWSDMTADVTQRGQNCIMDNLSVWMNYGHIIQIHEEEQENHRQRQGLIKSIQ